MLMNFYLSNSEFEFDIRNIFRIFDLNSKMIFKYTFKADEDELYIIINDQNIDDGYASVSLHKDGVELFAQEGRTSDIEIEKTDEKKHKKVLIKKLVYECLSVYYDYKSSYGILSGIRPGKLLTQAHMFGLSENKVMNIMKETYGVSDEKFDLLDDIYNIQKKYIGIDNDSFYNLYIGIPFCPTKCTYCSFISFARYEKHLVDEYVEILMKDVEQTIIMARLKGLKLHTIYFGGGTPSVLSIKNIYDIFNKISQYENIDDVTEVNFEAGRADTINKELLECLKDIGVDRICINPQTMKQSTLDLVKRNHTVEDVYRAYDLAKTVGFDSINMDLILGLPGENKSDVENTMKSIVEMNPENITIHTLAYKKGSKLYDLLKSFPENENSLVDVAEVAKNYCIDNDYMAYYMYRQKRIKDNLENIGYCKANKESIYNIIIIEEIETILACGVGAASKILLPNGKHKRISNYKSLTDYMDKINLNIEEKRDVLLAEG